MLSHVSFLDADHDCLRRPRHRPPLPRMQIFRPYPSLTHSLPRRLERERERERERWMLRVGGSSRGHFCLHVAVQIQAESDCPALPRPHTQTHTETHLQRSGLISAVCGQMPAGVSEADGQDCFSRLHRVGDVSPLVTIQFVACPQPVL